MSITIQDAAKQALEGLTEAEKRQCAIYAFASVLEPGEKVIINRREEEVSQATVLVFVDLMPPANWGHPCRYLLFDARSGEVISTIEAQFPPAAQDLQLVYRSASVEDWMLLTETKL